MCYADEVGIDPSELFTEVEPEEPPEFPPAGDPPEEAPEPPGVSRGLPEKDYGTSEDARTEDIIDRGELSERLNEIADIAAMDMGGYELLESLRSGAFMDGALPPGISVGLINDLQIIWGWGLPDGPDGPGSVFGLVDAAGLSGTESENLSITTAMVTLVQAFGDLDYDGIAAYGQYNGYGESMGAEFADQVVGLLDIAALPENAAAISAASEMLVGLTAGDLSLRMGDMITSGSV
jgi:hypothetical protein